MRFHFASCLVAICAPIIASAAINLGGVRFPADADEISSQSSRRGIETLTLDRLDGGRYYVTSYTWWSLLWGGIPRDAEAYSRSLSDEHEDDLVVIEPLTRGQINGQATWSMVKKYTVVMPSRGVPPRAFQEKVVLIQRNPHGYLVLRWVAPVSLYAAGLPEFERFVSGVQLSPTFPLSPRALVACLTIVAAVVIFLVKQRSFRT